MKPLKPEQKKLLTTCGLIVVIGLALTIATPKLGILSLLREEQEVKKELIEKEKQLQEAKERERILPQLQEQIAKTEEEIAEVERRLPNDKRAPELFRELNYLAEVAHQQYKSMDAKEVKDQGTYIEIPLEISLTADYHNLGRYINMIERSKRFAKVDQLEIAYDFDNPDQQAVKFIVSTFMFVKKSAAPAEAAPSATTRS